MRELDIDLANAVPKSVDSQPHDGVDVVVTMGCGDECPFIPGARVVDWEITDPAGRPDDEVRAIRDELAARVTALLAELS
jgi:arsenate reductase